MVVQLSSARIAAAAMARLGWSRRGGGGGRKARKREKKGKQERERGAGDRVACRGETGAAIAITTQWTCTPGLEWIRSGRVGSGRIALDQTGLERPGLEPAQEPKHGTTYVIVVFVVFIVVVLTITITTVIVIIIIIIIIIVKKIAKEQRSERTSVYARERGSAVVVPSACPSLPTDASRLTGGAPRWEEEEEEER